MISPKSMPMQIGFGFVVVLFLTGLYSVWTGSLPRPTGFSRTLSVYEAPGFGGAQIPQNSRDPNGTPRKTFFQIAREWGTDKVTTHHYQHMYQKYLEPLRDRRLKFLEIGLGCNMAYGPGVSYHTWLEFFPSVDLYYIEYNAECAKKWQDKTTQATIYTGDQADRNFLRRFLRETGGNFDVIIDDGGHTALQQLASYEELLPAVVPGGLYFIEDLQTSYIADFNKGSNITMMDRIKIDMDDMMLSFPRSPTAGLVWSIECMKEVCAFSRREKGIEYDDPF